jgi:hypothetical protein
MSPVQDLLPIAGTSPAALLKKYDPGLLNFPEVNNLHFVIAVRVFR